MDAPLVTENLYSTNESISKYGSKSYCALIIATCVFSFIFVFFFIAFYYFAFINSDFKSSFNILYLNDIHINPEYLPNGDPDQYCTKVNKNKTDVYYKWGIYGCDSPIDSYKSMLSFMPTVIQKPDLILFGGDAIGHGLKLDSFQVSIEVSKLIKLLSDTFPDTPLAITLGNNEFSPNYGTFETDPFDFGNLSESLSQYMNSEQLLTFKKGGYSYLDFSKQKLRLLLLNTVMYSIKRNISEDDDPWDQFAWIEEKSKEAESKKYNIGVAYHIPTGICGTDFKVGWHEKFINRYNQIMEKYDFKFQLAAHTHLDLYMPVFQNGLSQQRYQISAPSLSPNHGNNPGFRIYKIRNSEIFDYYQYYADIMMNPKELEWKLEYKYSSTFPGNDLSNKNIIKTINWTAETGEGMWKYLEHIYNRAGTTNSLYHCLLTCVTKEQVDKCLYDIQPLSLVQPEEPILYHGQYIERT